MKSFTLRGIELLSELLKRWLSTLFYTFLPNIINLENQKPFAILTEDKLYVSGLCFQIKLTKS